MVVVVVVVVAVATAVLLGAMSRAQRISSNYRGYTAVGFYAGSGHWDIGEQGIGDAVICTYSSKNKKGKEICIFVKHHQVAGNVYYSQSHAFAPAPSTPRTPLTSGFLDSCSSGIPAATVQIDEVERSAQQEVRVAPPLPPLPPLVGHPRHPPPLGHNDHQYRFHFAPAYRAAAGESLGVISARLTEAEVRARPQHHRTGLVKAHNAVDRVFQVFYCTLEGSFLALHALLFDLDALCKRRAVLLHLRHGCEGRGGRRGGRGGRRGR